MNTILKDLFKEVGAVFKELGAVRSEGESLRDISYLGGGSVFRLYQLLLRGPPPDSGRTLVVIGYSCLTFNSSVAVLFISIIK